MTRVTVKPYDASDGGDVKKAKKIQKILENRFRNGILKMVADPEMRYVLATFLDFTGPFRDDYVSDGRDHARNAGLRSGGLWWLTHLLLHDPEIVRKLQEDEDSPLKVKDQDDNRDNDSGSGDLPG